ERKTKMLENVEDQTKRLRYAADMLLAATWGAKNADELEAALNGMLAEVEYKFKDLPADQLEEEARTRFRKAGVDSRFHWPLEFPEVFVERSGFNAFVCNPPFKGGKHLRSLLGDALNDHIRSINDSIKGSPDLVAYFLLRAINLLEAHGLVG